MSLIELLAVLFWWIAVLIDSVSSYVKGLIFAILGATASFLVVFGVGGVFSFLLGFLLYFVGMIAALRVWNTPGHPSPQSQISAIMAGYMIGWIASSILKFFS